MMPKEESRETEGESNSPLQADPKTKHTTDPQEHMEGPVSSLMQQAGEGFDEDKPEDKKDEKG